VSTTSLTTLSVARLERAPRKSDLGRAAPDVGEDSSEADQSPSILDTLLATVPTSAVTLYTGYATLVVGNLKEPTPTDLHPSKLLVWRWLGFAVLVVLAFALTVQRYHQKRKEGMPKTPWLAATAATVAAIGWGLGIPDSPLAGSLHGDGKWIGPLLAAFIAAGINLVLAGFLNQQADPGSG
jgi:hypothetical protein